MDGSKGRRARAAIALGAIGIMTTGVSLPSGALEQSPIGLDDAPATTVPAAPGPAPTTGAGSVADLEAGAVIEPLAPVIDGVQRALTDLGGDGETGEDSGSSDPDDDGQTPTEPGDQQPPAESGGDSEPDPDEEMTAGNERTAAEEFAADPPAFVSHLDLTRELSLAAALLPPVALDLAAFVPEPVATFIEVAPGPRSTRDLVDALRAAGVGPEEMARLLAPFPVAGPAGYSNDWGAARHIPEPHAHEGTDIFAPRGTPVTAAMNGVVTRIAHDTAVGGNSLRVQSLDGTYLYYAHLEGFAPAAVEGTTVTIGTVLGYVGTSGNARGTPPHLHFEVHPRGGEPVPPLPYLDAWLADARMAVTAYLGGGQAPVRQPTLARAEPAQATAPIKAASSVASAPLSTTAFLAISGALWAAYRRRPMIGRTLRRFLPRLGAGQAPPPRERHVLDVLEDMVRKQSSSSTPPRGSHE